MKLAVRTRIDLISSQSATSRVCMLLVALCFSSAVRSDGKAQIMFSRYLKYQICMEKVYGQGFYGRLGLIPVLNPWGVSEPTSTSLKAAPLSVRAVDARCRSANDIDGEPRPR